jgi:hypothetical protein
VVSRFADEREMAVNAWLTSQECRPEMIFRRRHTSRRSPSVCGLTVRCSYDVASWAASVTCRGHVRQPQSRTMRYREAEAYTGAIPANCTALAHFSDSSAVSLANSAGE